MSVTYDLINWYQDNLIELTEQIKKTGSKNIKLPFTTKQLISVYYRYRTDIFETIEDEVTGTNITVFQYLKSKKVTEYPKKEMQLHLLYIAIDIIADWHSEEGIKSFLKQIKRYSIYA